MNITKNSIRLMSFSLAGLCGMMMQPQKAHAYDMDCKVILCIAGGFPAQCGDAYAYMIKRITRWPAPLPPFGFCAMSNGAEYTGHDVNYSFLGQGPQSYDCPSDKNLYYRKEEDEDGGNEREIAFCYSHMTQTKVISGDDDVSWQTVYENQSPAKPINFQLSIVIEPGSDQEFKSPLYRIHTGSGYVAQRPL